MKPISKKQFILFSSYLSVFLILSLMISGCSSSSRDGVSGDSTGIIDITDTGDGNDTSDGNDTGGDNDTNDIDGNVWGWGYNRHGQAGDSTNLNVISASIIGGLADVVNIDVGIFNSAAVKSDGTVWTVGDNSYGQLGIGESYEGEHGTSIKCKLLPVQVLGITDAIAISAGESTSMAMK